MIRESFDELDVSLIRCTECADIFDFHGKFSNRDSMGNGSGMGFSVIHQNIRSYRRNFDEFSTVLQGLGHKFNCIILTEAWLNDDSHPINISGYHSFRSFNNLNQSDGLVVYIDEGLPVTCNELVLGGLATCLSLTFTWAGAACEILAVYRSPSTNLTTFINALNVYCNEQSPGVVRILAGDFNCDTLNVAPGSVEEHYIDILSDAGFVPCIDKVTRPASGTCIDHFFVKLPRFFNASSVILQSSVTDHYAICLNILSTKTHKPPNTDRVIIKTDWKKVRNTLSSHNWNRVIEQNNVDNATDIFIESVQNIIAEKSHEVKVSSRNTQLKPWITAGLVNSIRHRDKLRKKLNRQPFNYLLRNEFTQYRNMLHSAIKRAKYNYYKNKVEEATGNPRKFWSVINEISGRIDNSKSFPVSAFSRPGEVIDSQKTKEIANQFNQYFAKVGTNLANSIITQDAPVVRDDEHAADSEFQLQPVSRQELEEVVKSLKGRSAPGCDGIPTRVIKNNIDILIHPILHIVNLSILVGHFPCALKTARVIPIYKSGPKGIFSNYRPISLLATLSKIIEKCIKIQLTKYLNEYNLISNSQYGFQKSKNTSDTLFNMSRAISSSIKSRRKVLITFLDLAKAFDTVDRRILIKKLESLGIKNISLRWFKSYFHNRQQSVCINGENSDKENVEYGVVQGSTLGPLLFLIYINNLSKLVVEGELYLFADDTALVSTGSTWEEAYMSASIDLSKIKNWFDHNSLTVNVEKTKFMPIVTRNQADPGSLILTMHSCNNPRSAGCNCSMIERVDHYKYLGVVLDSKMSWVQHVQCAKNRLRKLLHAFSELSNVLSVDQCKVVYFAYVQSIILYGILAWGGASSSVIEPLAVTQRSIIKTILKRDFRYPTRQLFIEFPVLNVRQLFIKSLLIHIKKYKTELLGETVNHSYSTRHRSNYSFEIPQLTHGSELTNPSYLAHVLYRNVPGVIREAEAFSLVVFRKRVDRWLYQIGWEASEELLQSRYAW